MIRLINISDDDAGHLLEAFRIYQKYLRTNGYQQLPLGIAQLMQALELKDDQTAPLPDTELLLLNREAVANRLQISVRVVQRLVGSGQLPSIKIGRLRRVHRDDLLAYVESLRSQ